VYYFETGYTKYTTYLKTGVLGVPYFRKEHHFKASV